MTVAINYERPTIGSHLFFPRIRPSDIKQFCRLVDFL